MFDFFKKKPIKTFESMMGDFIKIPMPEKVPMPNNFAIDTKELTVVTKNGTFCYDNARFYISSRMLYIKTDSSQMTVHNLDNTIKYFYKI